MKRHQKIVITAVIVAGIIGGHLLYADTDVKQVFIRSSKLKVLQFKTDKKAYEVNEPITITVKLNKDAYVYLFNIDRETGETYMIFPNKYARNNRFKGSKTFKLPNNAKWEIVSNKPGVEEFMLVASTSKQNFNFPSSSTKGGVFQRVDEENVSKLLSIRRRAHSSNRRGKKDEVVTLRYTVTIHEPGSINRVTSNQSDRDMPVILLNVAPLREFYYIGDTLLVAYGSTYDGYVYLMIYYPESGDKELLEEARVRGNQIYRDKFQVAPPEGEQYLVAVYSPTRLKGNGGTVIASKAFNLTGQTPTKGLRPLSSSSSAESDDEIGAKIYQVVPIVVKRR